MISGPILEVILEAKGGLGSHFERLLVTLGSILVCFEGTQILMISSGFTGGGQNSESAES